MNVAVIGSGSWGTAVAAMVAPRVPTTLWTRRDEAAAQMNSDRENKSYLPGIMLPEALVVTADLTAALEGTDVIVLAVPSHGFRDVL